KAFLNFLVICCIFKSPTFFLLLLHSNSLNFRRIKLTNPPLESWRQDKKHTAQLTFNELTIRKMDYQVHKIFITAHYISFVISGYFMIVQWLNNVQFFRISPI